MHSDLKISDRVYITAGAKIFDDISICDAVIGGANSVITDSVPLDGIKFGANEIIEKKIDYWTAQTSDL